MLVELIDGLDIIGHLHGWRSVRATERFMEVGAWDFTAPLVSSNEGLLVDWATRDRPGISIRDEDTGWRYVGLLTELTIDDLISEGQVWRASGNDFNVLLADRLVRPHPNEADWWRFAEDVISGPPENIADNIVQLDPGRAL